MIEVATPKQMKEPPYSTRAGTQALSQEVTLDQQADFKLNKNGNWEPVQNITEERCTLSDCTAALHIEDRLQAIDKPNI